MDKWQVLRSGKKRRKISNIFETADFLLSKDRLWSKDRLRVNTSSYTFRRASAKDCCTFGPYSCRVRFAHGSGGSISMTAHDVRLLCWILCIHTYIYSHIFIYIYTYSYSYSYSCVYTHIISFLLGFRIRYFWLLPKIQKKNLWPHRRRPPRPNRHIAPPGRPKPPGRPLVTGLSHRLNPDKSWENHLWH
jgi:hypothetical protein